MTNQSTNKQWHTLAQEIADTSQQDGGSMGLLVADSKYNLAVVG